MKTALVIKPGIFTSIQDLGRVGLRRFGVTYAGVMDSTSAVNANIMCGNSPFSALLECTYNSPVLRMMRPVTIAVTGVDVHLIVDGIEKEEKVYKAQEGDIIKINIKKGARGYIAFRGGVDVPLVQESRSTDTISGIGGHILKAGDVIYCFEDSCNFTHSLIARPDFSSNDLKMNLGPEYHLLSAENRQLLTTSEWVVTSKSNRMSFLLNGPPLQTEYHHMLSSPVMPGTIQLPPSGLPIILGNDAQTTGGYARIGILESRSYQILSQKLPGEKITLSLLEE